MVLLRLWSFLKIIFLLCTETKPHLTNGQSKYLAKVTYLTNIFIMAFGCHDIHDILLTYRKHT